MTAKLKNGYFRPIQYTFSPDLKYINILNGLMRVHKYEYKELSPTVVTFRLFGCCSFPSIVDYIHSWWCRVRSGLSVNQQLAFILVKVGDVVYVLFYNFSQSPFQACRWPPKAELSDTVALFLRSPLRWTRRSAFQKTYWRRSHYPALSWMIDWRGWTKKKHPSAVKREKESWLKGKKLNHRTSSRRPPTKTKMISYKYQHKKSNNHWCWTSFNLCLSFISHWNLPRVDFWHWVIPILCPGVFLLNT